MYDIYDYIYIIKHSEDYERSESRVGAGAVPFSPKHMISRTKYYDRVSNPGDSPHRKIIIDKSQKLIL